MITLLELLEVLARKGKYIMSGLIEVWIDNRYINRKVYRELIKQSLFSQDARVEITRMREILDTTNFAISINIISEHPKVRAPFAEDSGPYLIRRYDCKARKVREKIYMCINQSNIKFSGAFTIEKDGAIINRSVKEIM